MYNSSSPDQNLWKEGGFAFERSRHHREQIRAALRDKGFGDFAHIQFSSSDDAVPLAFLTGASVEVFDPERHALTPTKSIINVNNVHYILNQSAAIVPALLEQGDHAVLVQVRPDKEEDLRKAFSGLPHGDRLHFIPVRIEDPDFLAKFYARAAGISRQQAVSRLDIVLYESFAMGASHPFKPIYAESAEVVGNAVTKRARFFHDMCMAAYDMMVNYGHRDLRIVALTALAARRAGGNLLADAAHKHISTNYLETFAAEAAFHFPDNSIHCIEIAPGIVDNGIYDSADSRVATVERAAINGHHFDDSAACAASIGNLPKLSPFDVGLVAAQYLVRKAGESFHDALPEAVQALATAGRGKKELSALLSAIADGLKNNLGLSSLLPSWSMTLKSQLGRFPALQAGYQFIPVCPMGQKF